MRLNISKDTILAERLRRQGLTEPLQNPDDYVEFFRSLQPVLPDGAPGDPPRLFHRTTFDDGILADRMRERRDMVKGRFLGGTIGYVLAEDLELYANAFCNPLPVFNEIQQTVFDAIRNAETLTPRQLKDETGLLNKKIMPVLHRLQEAFLVFEDQINNNWERNWYEFATEWPEVNITEEKQEMAVAEVLQRFISNHVFATFEQIRDWSRLSSKLLMKVLEGMKKNKVIIPQSLGIMGEGWMCAQDITLKPPEIQPSVFMLRKTDILVRSHYSELKRRFGDYEVLQYLLIDGVFNGAVIGHWRIGPHDVEDIVLELPEKERKNRREEILKVVADYYHPPFSHILGYAGRELDFA